MAAAILMGGSALSGASPRDVIDPHLQAALESADPTTAVPVIVTFSASPKLPEPIGESRRVRRRMVLDHLRSLNEASRRPLEAILQKATGASATPLWITNGVSLSARPAVIRELASHPGVGSVRLDRDLPAHRLSQSAPAKEAWNLSALHANLLWAQGHTGSGIVVAGLDTGVDANHPDLAPSWRGGENSWFDPAGQHPTPADVDGHGTQTMGILVGGSASGIPIGVAPGARWIAAKIYDDSGRTTLSAIHRSLQWLLDPDGDPDTDDAPDVVSNSWGMDGMTGRCDREFEADVAALRGAGIAVVFAAGNEGPHPGTSLSPANYPTSLAVGSVDEAGAIPPASSRGPSACGGGLYPALVAPGVAVRTADLTYGGTIPHSYGSYSGTSYAAPHVAGAFALLLGAHPGVGAAGVEQALLETAVDLGALGPDEESGHGLLDVAAAHRMLSQLRAGERAATGRPYGCSAGGHSPDGAMAASILLLLLLHQAAARRRRPAARCTLRRTVPAPPWIPSEGERAGSLLADRIVST